MRIIKDIKGYLIRRKGFDINKFKIIFLPIWEYRNEIRWFLENKEKKKILDIGFCKFKDINELNNFLVKFNVEAKMPTAPKTTDRYYKYLYIPIKFIGTKKDIKKSLFGLLKEKHIFLINEETDGRIIVAI
jgi:hypothetical protein